MEAEIELKLLEEVKKVLDQSGIRSLINYLWLTIKHLGRNPPTAAINIKKYREHKKLTDVDTLRHIRNNLIHTLNIYPRESYKFHNNEKFTFLRYCWNTWYATDKNRFNQKYISATTKRDAVFRYKTYGQKIVIDKAEESNFSKPSFFVIKEGKQYTIVVRGTANGVDKLLDIDITPIEIEDYEVHQGFYRHAEEIYQQMEDNHILSDENTYVTTGYSMGGAVSCLLAYLIYTNVTTSVHSYGFGSGCVGDINFVKFTQNFTTTVVDGFDFVPQMTMHGFYCQCERLLYENNKGFYKSNPERLKQASSMNLQLIKMGKMDIQKQHSDLAEQQINLDQIQVYELFSREPFSKELSEAVMTEYDMFVGGNLYHCTHGEIVEISIHDYSEFYPSPVGFIDHYTYPWLRDELARLIQFYSEKE